MKRIGVLTSGGDTPGMNAAIRAVFKTGVDIDLQVMGIYHGYKGLIEGRVGYLAHADVESKMHKGGTILRTARSEEFKTEGGIEKAISVLRAYEIEGLIVIGGGITAARKYILPSLLAEMRGSLHTFSGETLPRVQMKVYDLDDATQFAAFAQGDSRRIKVYGSDREIVYDPQKRIGVMTSHIGASRAISLGAYAFALNSIDRDAR